MRNTKVIYALAILLFVSVSCSRDDDAEDEVSPVIQVVTPTNNQTFTGGQTVNITGNVSDNGTIVEVHVHIFNTTSGQQLIDINRFPNAANYTINENFQVVAGIQYKIQIIATDKSANQDIEDVFVSAN
jgi:hypothetical protein